MIAKKEQIQEPDFEHPLAQQEASSGRGGWIALIAVLSIVGVVVWLVLANQD